MNQPLKLNARGLPVAQGLYDPQFESDACGFGFVCSIKGVASKNVVRQALEMLERMEHRGACGCEDDSGDGAGIMVATPDKFFRKHAKKLGMQLPPKGQYAVAMLFLPKDLVQRRYCENIFEEHVRRYDMRVLGWRDVPVDSTQCGPTPRSVEPRIRQCFVGMEDRFYNRSDFNRRLYLIRQQVENNIEHSAASSEETRKVFYINLISTNRMVYKGMLTAQQVRGYYKDLSDPDFESPFAIVHSRFSTNTFPSWRLAHPYRYLAHNGEINTLRGNRNWMKARYASLASKVFGDELDKLFPILSDMTSDSATLDNTLQFLSVNGRTLPHAMLMLIPEAWQNNTTMDPELRAFYEYHAMLMEPWDGPAGVAFTDGNQIGAVLDRNGLRPARYWVTSDDLVIMASESGVIPVPPEKVLRKWRLQPGKMLLIDFQTKKKIIDDAQIKAELMDERPWKRWIEQNLIDLESLPEPKAKRKSMNVDRGLSNVEVPPQSTVNSPQSSLTQLQHAFGYSTEDLRLLMQPMASTGAEAVGSMGTDTPLACLSDRPQALFNYFKQLFAQVTNPPLDAIREELVTSLLTYLGREGNLLGERPESARMIRLQTPVITSGELAKLEGVSGEGFVVRKLSTLFACVDGEDGFAAALDKLCDDAVIAVSEGVTILILSDRGVDHDRAALPSLLATSAVHHALTRRGIRTQVGLVIETGEAREPHHLCCLLGYGAGAINPYLALDTLADLHAQGLFDDTMTAKLAQKNFIKAANKSILKVASKMGISTVQSYRGAQIFEAVGVGREVIDAYFTGTSSRIGGIGLDMIAKETLAFHRRGFPPVESEVDEVLSSGGMYQWRRDGEFHAWNPLTVAKLQQAVRFGKLEQASHTDVDGSVGTEGANHDDRTDSFPQDSAEQLPLRDTGDAMFRPEVFRLFQDYSNLVDDESRARCTIRGLLKFKPTTPIPITQVEAAVSIVKRFATGAMSFGSISKESHETLAIAMNRLGGKSNSGEGGEDKERFATLRTSAIKQVASGRFGVTIDYLASAKQLQIKMAQGAKPGEGGALAGNKIDTHIAAVRNSTPGVGLISPPPHHDIYSIEDLAQLIHDLKNSNPKADVSVKLVSAVGVGTIAAGVAKAKADHILISGDGGGTGNAPMSSIKHCGLPWELGLAEAQQVLVMNGLRGRVRLQADGQMKTGRDAIIAALLGAEEVGFATAPLIAAGCVMMRVCHLNTCPVGIATQDPELRKKFTGTPEHVINFMFFIAEEVRLHMASLGIATWDELIGRVDLLEIDPIVRTHPKAQYLDLDAILFQPAVRKGDTTRCTMSQDHGLRESLDNHLIAMTNAMPSDSPRTFEPIEVRNTHRSIGTMLSGHLSRAGQSQRADETLHFKLNGTAGQSLGAFLTKGITLELEGDTNDYCGKGLCGGRVIVYPPKASRFKAEENIIAGNVIGYGATSGELYLRGIVGERFCVRNSGATAVVEGCGDHGCEYMTGGRVAVLGATGRNFAAGMSGGIAYVYDTLGQLKTLCNSELVELGGVTNDNEIAELKAMLEKHHQFTGSTRAAAILGDWANELKWFVRVMPVDYKRALEQQLATAN